VRPNILDEDASKPVMNSLGGMVGRVVFPNSSSGGLFVFDFKVTRDKALFLVRVMHSYKTITLKLSQYSQ
jgi:hypothetical protein